eukprot:Amastigsp_a860579_23.p4 type:complete len:110 gc:universal Amastigsp_a860579_23:103-432(+)
MRFDWRSKSSSPRFRASPAASASSPASLIVQYCRWRIRSDAFFASAEARMAHSTVRMCAIERSALSTLSLCMEATRLRSDTFRVDSRPSRSCAAESSVAGDVVAMESNK